MQFKKKRSLCKQSDQQKLLVTSPFLVNRHSFFLKFIYFIYYLFLAVLGLRCYHGLSLVAVSGGYSSLWCTGFSLRWLLLLESTGSRCANFSSCGSQALERRRSSCGARAQLLRGMWDLPEPGLVPVSPALAGGFLTAAPPGKPVNRHSNAGVSNPWASDLLGSGPHSRR